MVEYYRSTHYIDVLVSADDTVVVPTVFVCLLRTSFAGNKQVFVFNTIRKRFVATFRDRLQLLGML